MESNKGQRAADTKSSAERTFKPLPARLEVTTVTGEKPQGVNFSTRSCFVCDARSVIDDYSDIWT